MPTLLRSSEKAGCGATIKLDNGEVVYVSIAQVGVLVRHWDMSGGFLKTFLSNFFGAKLYNESSVYKNAQTAGALHTMFPEQAAPLQFKNPVLAAFSNAIWHCASAAEVCTVLNEAAAKLGQEAETPKQPPETTVASAMETYRLLLVEHPLAILDTAMLPIPKTQMKVLLKSLYAKVPTAELRNYIEQGYMFLSNFQDGVGRVPIDGGIKFSGAVPTQAEIAQLEKWSAWQKVALAEMEILSAEWARFKAGEPI